MFVYRISTWCQLSYTIEVFSISIQASIYCDFINAQLSEWPSLTKISLNSASLFQKCGDSFFLSQLLCRNKWLYSAVRSAHTRKLDVRRASETVINQNLIFVSLYFMVSPKLLWINYGICKMLQQDLLPVLSSSSYYYKLLHEEITCVNLNRTQVCSPFMTRKINTISFWAALLGY